MAKRELDSSAFSVKKVGVLQKHKGRGSENNTGSAPAATPNPTTETEPVETTTTADRGAAIPRKERKKPGRKREHGEHGQKMGCPVTVNFTPDEKEKLEVKSRELMGAPITKIIRNALKNADLI